MDSHPEQILIGSGKPKKMLESPDLLTAPDLLTGPDFLPSPNQEKGNRILGRFKKIVESQLPHAWEGRIRMQYDRIFSHLPEDSRLQAIKPVLEKTAAIQGYALTGLEMTAVAGAMIGMGYAAKEGIRRIGSMKKAMGGIGVAGATIGGMLAQEEPQPWNGSDIAMRIEKLKLAEEKDVISQLKQKMLLENKLLIDDKPNIPIYRAYSRLPALWHRENNTDPLPEDITIPIYGMILNRVPIDQTRFVKGMSLDMKEYIESRNTELRTLFGEADFREDLIGVLIDTRQALEKHDEYFGMNDDPNMDRIGTATNRIGFLGQLLDMRSDKSDEDPLFEAYELLNNQIINMIDSISS